MKIIAIDPGTEQSAIVTFDGTTVKGFGVVPNREVFALLDDAAEVRDILAIEMIESFGMAVGREVFETVFWTGRFAQCWASHFGQFVRVPRREVKLHLCASPRATDANIRQALIDRFGPGSEKAIGKKKTPGPLYGLKGHEFAALGVAITHWDGAHREADSRAF